MSQLSFNPSLDSVARTPGASRFQDLTSEDFVKIIFTELSNQDPFAPNDSSALLQQLSSIRSIESDLKLTQRLETLVAQNQLSSAGAMVGKFIGGLNEALQRVSGFVQGVSREGDRILLELDSGHAVPMDHVEIILDPDLVGEGR
ncbi:MAG: hypothetical protein HRU76_10840 [Phycisphaeraceae bacterium]|nr:hypothetical protein [Phycisphaerales bacterium]QOJ18052.1 MAG: hypothetical protein HRU76_10840 [Phycisphaeraceae bacterium]